MMYMRVRFHENERTDCARSNMRYDVCTYEGTKRMTRAQRSCASEKKLGGGKCREK